METHRLVGVVVELVIALGLVAAGAAALTGRVRGGRGWSLGWGGVPGRVDGAAMVALGVGVAVWAVSQAQDRAMGQAVAGIVVVVLSGAVLAASQLRRAPD